MFFSNLFFYVFKFLFYNVIANGFSNEYHYPLDNRIAIHNAIDMCVMVCVLFHFNVCLLVFCCFFVFCGRAKKVVREGPISGGLKRVPQVEEALVEGECTSTEVN